MRCECSPWSDQAQITTKVVARIWSPPGLERHICWNWLSFALSYTSAIGDSVLFLIQFQTGSRIDLLPILTTLNLIITAFGMVQKPKELDLHFLSNTRIFQGKVLWIELNDIHFDSKMAKNAEKHSFSKSLWWQLAPHKPESSNGFGKSVNLT